MRSGHCARSVSNPMPSIEVADLHQYAVLWAATGTNSYGEPTTAAPVELRCRWLWGQHMAGGAAGGTQPRDATVIVAQPVEEGSLMWEGRLAEWYGTGSAGDDSAVMQVVSVRHTPDLKNRHFRRELGLRYFRDTLPE